MIREATEADVTSAVLGAGELSKQDFANQGCGDLRSMLSRAQELNRSGVAFALPNNGEILCVLGFVEDANDPQLLYTWFIATDEFYTRNLEMARLGRGFMKTVFAAFPGKTIRTITHSTHPQVGKWFALFGMEKLPSGQYEFVSKR